MNQDKKFGVGGKDLMNHLFTKEDINKFIENNAGVSFNTFDHVINKLKKKEIKQIDKTNPKGEKMYGAVFNPNEKIYGI